MSDDLLKLADRVEAATGTDRELDAKIFEAATPDAIVLPDGRGGRIVMVQGFRTTEPFPAYTASLDAAMTLAESFGGQVTFFKDGTAKAFLWQPYPLAVEAKAATPALALCAAALRARSAA